MSMSKRSQARGATVYTLDKDEGYRGTPYQDTKKIWTFGHGFTFISREHSKLILGLLVDDLWEKVEHRYVDEITGGRTSSQGLVIHGILVEMAFQMGLGGLEGFRRFRAALRRSDYAAASDEMLFSNPTHNRTRRSQWYKDTPARCRRAAARMRVIRG